MHPVGSLLVLVTIAQSPSPSQSPSQSQSQPAAETCPRLFVYPGDFTLLEETFTAVLAAGRSTIRLDIVGGNVDPASLAVVPLDEPQQVKVVAMTRRSELGNATFVEVESAAARSERFRVSYALRGLSAAIRYEAVLDETARTLDLVQELEVANSSGESFEQVAVRSVFGDVRTVSSNAVLHGRAADPAADAPPGLPAEPLRQDLAEHTIVSFGAPMALRDGTTLRRQSLRRPSLPVTIEYRYDATSSARVTRVVKVANKEGAGLGGITLQPGALNLVTRMPGMADRFLRSATFAHLPAGKDLELDGGATDQVFVEREQKDLARSDLVFGEYNRALVSYSVVEAYRLEVRNHLGEACSLVVTEHVDGTDTFAVVESSHHAVRKDQNALEFRLDVPAGAKLELTYRVKKSNVKA